MGNIPPFCLPHHGDQDYRYNHALNKRNVRFAYNERKVWSHACEDCLKYTTRPDGSPGMLQFRFLEGFLTCACPAYISAVVTDGVTVGHPCCAVLNCQNDLEHGCDRHCPHHSQNSAICAIDGCSALAGTQFVTCADPQHRLWEEK